LKQLALLLTPVCQLQQRQYTNPRQLRPAGKGFRQRCSLAELPWNWVRSRGRAFGSQPGRRL